MTIEKTAILEALDEAAQAGDDRITAQHLGSPSVSAQSRVYKTRNTIVRFLENVPPNLTVADLLEDLTS